MRQKRGGVGHGRLQQQRYGAQHAAPQLCVVAGMRSRQQHTQPRHTRHSRHRRLFHCRNNARRARAAADGGGRSHRRHLATQRQRKQRIAYARRERMRPHRLRRRRQ